MAVLEQMKLLINLARIDGTVADREKVYIQNIGKANGIAADTIEPLFERKHELVVPGNLTDDQKFEEKYLDVLQNIEFGIVNVYRQHPELRDAKGFNVISSTSK